MDLDRTRADWTTLGAEDQLWAVLVNPQARHEGWQGEEFLETGRTEVDDVLARVRALGVTLGTGAAVDFGWGAGRLSQALRSHFDRVVGIDFSSPMLERARVLDPDGTCEFVMNDGPDLQSLATASFDLAYSSLVFQHIPTRRAAVYLSELVRVVRPGGVVVVQVATRPDSSAKGRLAAVMPRPLMRFVQRRVLGYPAPMDMYPMPRSTVEAAVGERGRVLAAWDEPMYGGHWRYTRYAVERR
jgi:SAM-dependent methyltransferase